MALGPGIAHEAEMRFFAIGWALLLVTEAYLPIFSLASAIK